MALKKNRIIIWFLGSLLGIVGLLAADTWVTLACAYPYGERSGFVQKFSKKGWVCKTREGELTMVQLPGSIPEKFFFTVRNDEKARKIQAMMGKRVHLAYDQHSGWNSTGFRR